MATYQKPNENAGVEPEGSLDLLDRVSDAFGKAWASFAKEILAIKKAPQKSRYQSSAGEGMADVKECVPLEDLIRNRLKRINLSQSELASRMNVSPPVISRILSRPWKTKIATLDRLARAMDLNGLEELFMLDVVERRPEQRRQE